MITVYHGSTMLVDKPIANIGRDNLDFGKAFYVTRVREQTEKWAQIVYTKKEEGVPTLNTYRFEIEMTEKYKTLRFDEYDKAWLDFIVESRLGKRPWLGYDIIEGGVANDRIIDTVEGYMNGDFDAVTAIGRLKYHKPNNQIAITNQRVIDELLHFERYEELKTE